MIPDYTWRLFQENSSLKRGNPPFCGTTNVFFREAAITNHLSCDQKPWKNRFVWRVQYTSVLYYTVLSSYEKDHNKPANQDIYLTISIQLLHQKYRFVPFIGLRSNEKIWGGWLTSRRHHRLPIQWNFSVGVPGDFGMPVKPPPNGKRLRYIDPGGDCYLASQVIKGCAIPILLVIWGRVRHAGLRNSVSNCRISSTVYHHLEIFGHFGAQQSLATPRFGVSFSLRCQVKWLSVQLTQNEWTQRVYVKQRKGIQ